MFDGGTKIDRRMLRTYVLEAEMEILELNRQITERARLSIPTVGLEATLSEQTAARDILRARLKAAEENVDGRRQEQDREARPGPD
jgi:hypothetical protein